MEKINKFQRWLLKAPSQTDLLRVFKAWRLYIIGAIFGGLFGTIVYIVYPPPYQAQAIVVVDHNLEEAFPRYPDREVFYFLERETNKLINIAWSDAVLQKVVDQEAGTSLVTLRSGILILNQPADGGWQFIARDNDPARAERLASLWASAFVDRVQGGIEVAGQIAFLKNTLTTLTRSSSTALMRCQRILAAEKSFAEFEDELGQRDFQMPFDVWRVSEIFAWTRLSGYSVDELDALATPESRQQFLQSLKGILDSAVATCKTVEGPDQEQIEQEGAKLAQLQKQSLGVESTVLVTLDQSQSLPVQRSVSLGEYVLIGTGVLTLLLIAFVLVVDLEPA